MEMSAKRVAPPEKIDDPNAGLSTAEAIQRLKQYGPNELPEKKTSAVLKFLSYFWGPIAWMIELAIILSAVVRHWSDFFIILTLLLANAVVGFWEEYQAGNTIEALKKKLALSARVKRDGIWKLIAAREIVPGDLIRLRIGDAIPADAKLRAGDPISVDQAALTGESLPVSHGSGDLVYAGSIVKQGEIDAQVSATGANTFFGKTARLSQEARGASHFQKAILKIGDYLIVLAIVLVTLIFLIALFRGDDLLTTFEFALVLTIAAIPVALPTVLSVTMAVGARLLALKQAVVTRLASIEEIAGIDILCSDKTGTLTQNKLSLGKPYSAPGFSPDEVIATGALASRREDQDPIDLAVLEGVEKPNQLESFTTVHFKPFDPVSKRTEAEVQDSAGKTFSVSKGAFQVILSLCHPSAELEAAAQDAVQGFARRGFRSLAVARKEGEKWVLLGILPLFDPPRIDSKSTIQTAKEMGIDVKMVTGDQMAIAREVAAELGLGTDILDTTAFTQPQGLLKNGDAIESADGYAQVFPEHKHHIIDSLQKKGHIVGMTGDGVNDAPALKKSDAGIAVSGATDAARAAADIVLLTPGLSVIIDAVKESRRIFQRMQSYAIYRISETIRVLLFMTFSILVFNFYPVTAIMIVLLALLNDGAILTIAYDRVQYSKKPERWNMRTVLGISSVLGVTGVTASFGLFYLAEQVFHLSRDVIQTLMYLKLSVAGHFMIFQTRVRGPWWSSRPAPILMFAVFATQIIATLIAVYGIFMTPIGWHAALYVWAYSLAWFLFTDRVKIAAYKIFGSEESALVKMRLR